jgi:type IV pilus assembly protein PilW
VIVEYVSQRAGGLRQRGLSLVELMISMVLGLLIVGGAITVFVSNRQAFVATENLSRMQETGRVAFELMARDMREAGGGACQSDRVVRNLLVTPGTRWWTNQTEKSASTVVGFAAAVPFPEAAFGTAVGDRVDGTAALEVKGVSSTGILIDSQGDASTLNQTDSPLTLSTTNHGFVAGDLAMACNFEGSAIFQISSVAGATINHAATGTPGNATAHLSVVNTRRVFTDPSTAGQAIKITCRDKAITVPTGVSRCGGDWTATIAKYNASRWYIANNARGGRSLVRQSVVTTGGIADLEEVEVADNVTDMEITYLERNGTSYLDASDPELEFGVVTAVRIVLTIESADSVSSDATRLTRTVQQTINLRNRMQ